MTPSPWRYTVLLSICFWLLTLGACSAEDQTETTSDPSTTVSEEPSTSRDIGEEVDPCSLLTIDEVSKVMEDPQEGRFSRAEEGNTECVWQTDTGGFQESELTIQVTDGGEGSSATDTLEVLREAMEVRDEIEGLGDEALSVDWGEVGRAHVVASGSRIIIISTSDPADGAALLEISRSAVEALP